MNVLLPQPDGPITAVIRFRYTSSSTRLIAAAEPYFTARSWMSKTTSRWADNGVASR